MDTAVKPRYDKKGVASWYSTPMRQLSLEMKLNAQSTFANFYAGKNQTLIEYLQHPTEKYLYLTGEPGSGVSHLLQALCHQSDSALYVPLRHPDIRPDILQSLDYLGLLAIDDIDFVAGQKNWEEALFNVFNERFALEKPLIMASHALSPIPFALPDLSSRIKSMLYLRLEPLDDNEKMHALQLQANNRGFKLSDTVVKYILHHASRDPSALFQILDELDQISLEEKSRISIPLVKKVLYNS